MKSYVYILKFENNKYYVGSTNNLDRRLKQHISSHTYSTKRMGKFKLVFSQEYSSLSLARKIEYKIKSLKRRDYVEKIIKDGYIKIMLGYAVLVDNAQECSINLINARVAQLVERSPEEVRRRKLGAFARPFEIESNEVRLYPKGVQLL